MIAVSIIVLLGILASAFAKEANTEMYISIAGSLVIGALAFFAAFKPKKWMGVVLMTLSVIPLFFPNFEYKPALFIGITAFIFLFGLSVVVSLKKREVIG